MKKITFFFLLILLLPTAQTFSKTKYYRWPNGRIRRKISYRRGKKHGSEIWFYRSGRVSKRKRWNKGKKWGLETWLYKTGRIWAKYNYYKGRRHGISLEFYPNGRIKQRKMYRHGRFHGEIRNLYAHGQLKSKLTYKNGKMHGVYNFYNRRGILLESTMYSSGKRANSVQWDDEGYKIKKVFYNARGRVHREWRYLRYSITKYMRSSRIRNKNARCIDHKSSYHGKLHGCSYTFHKSGKLKEIVVYKGGRPYKKIKCFYNSRGKLYMECEYKITSVYEKGRFSKAFKY